jgi:hypothetical protein
MAAFDVTHPCDVPRLNRPAGSDSEDLHVTSGMIKLQYQADHDSPPLSRTLAPTINIAVTENGDRFRRL